MFRVLTIAAALGCTAELPVPAGDGGEDATFAADGGVPADAAPRDAAIPGDAGQAPLDERCVDLRRGGGLYRVCRQRQSHPDAQRLCAAAGLDLFVPDSPGEGGWVWDRAQEIERGPYWIGRDACTEIRGRDVSNPRPCDDLLPYICENRCAAGVDEVCADGRDDDCDGFVDEGCSDCVLHERGDRDFIFCDDPVAWSKARLKCRALGGDLAILDDGELSRWAWAHGREVRDASWWAGKSDLEIEGEWRWVDGTRGEYDGWGRGQPDDWEGREDCLELPSWDRGGRWNDADCATESPYVCER